MRRIAMFACATGLWALPAAAQELELRPPALARECSPDLLAACNGPQRRPLERELSCDVCGAPTAAQPSAPRAAASGRRLECASQAMPLAAPVAGCTPPPLDSVPRP